MTVKGHVKVGDFVLYLSNAYHFSMCFVSFKAHMLLRTDKNEQLLRTLFIVKNYTIKIQCNSNAKHYVLLCKIVFNILFLNYLKWFKTCDR